MLHGIDISHHNYDMLTKTNLGKFIMDKVDFYIAKVSEGKDWFDPDCWFWDTVFPETTLRGYYHYARPENNSPKEEAQHFLYAAQSAGMRHSGDILALDWEGEALKYDIEWAVEWCQTVHSMVGYKPLIYIQESAIPSAAKLAELDYGLWVAKWSDGTEMPNIGRWPFYAIWQYRSTPIDMNVFNGNADQWKAYAMPKK